MHTQTIQTDAQREKLLQNLRDADCSEQEIADFLTALDRGCQKKALAVLARHRQTLLEQFHHSKRCIDCLDYLVCQMEKPQRR